MKRVVSSFCLILLLFLMACTENTQAQKSPSAYDSLLSRINLPQGFEIDIYMANLTDARSLARTDDGKTVFVGNRRRKNVYALTDTDGDMKADQVDTIATGLFYM